MYEETPIRMASNQQTEEEIRDRVVYELMMKVKSEDYETKIAVRNIERALRQTQIQNQELVREQKSLRSQVKKINHRVDVIEIERDTNRLKMPKIINHENNN